ncbi:TRAP transporter small permease [Nesterenkonia sp. Act20]|uniref:TRAP transporter small permease n=1 Tax=Nesterenkonia sp. Act20 TaxID=1483432 RepID=UPI001C463629|nr:TRAP transporter small permease [Nesterenkonia sp. Act20]
MSHLHNWVTWTLRVICVALFALLVIIVVWQVVSRLVLGDPASWTEEAARFTFIWVSLIGVSIAVSEKTDIFMGFIVERLPLMWQRVTEIMAHLATAAVVLHVMLIGGMDQVSQAWTQTNPVLPFTQGQLYLALPISGALLLFFLLIHMIHALSPRYTGRSGAPDDHLEATAQ